MKTFLPLLLLLFFAASASAADPRELFYNWEVLKPNHAGKPKVELGAEARIEEVFHRGFIAVPRENQVYLSWRLLPSDTPEEAFHLFRAEHDERGNPGERTHLALTITQTTDFLDTTVEAGKTYRYEILTTQKISGAAVTVTVNAPPAGMAPVLHRIPLKDGISPQRVAVGDLNGDGRWDFVILHPNTGIDPGGQPCTDGTTYKLDAYLADGTFLWRHDLGPGIEPGVWYSPFIVYDFDGDGRAEVALKAAPEEVKRDENGRVLEGLELLVVLDGMTGEKLAEADWPARTPRLGDYNRQNRNQLTVARLDGKTPCIIALRGTYKAMLAHAWQFKDAALNPVWQWDGDEENPVIRGQGAHNSQVADVDGDGRDEILIGSAMLDDDGTLLWSAGLGHPDSAILTVIDPRLPGMLVLFGVEVPHETRGVCMVDAKTGRQIWNLNRPTKHVGGAMAADLDPTKPGLECFASEDSKGGSRDRYMLDAAGTLDGTAQEVPGTRDWIWWDADKLRETFTWLRGTPPDAPRFRVKKYNGPEISDVLEGRVMMIADLYGDWREEIVTAMPGELRIYTTETPAADRRATLLADPKYRTDVINRSQGYAQAPVPSYYLGE